MNLHDPVHSTIEMVRWIESFTRGGQGHVGIYVGSIVKVTVLDGADVVAEGVGASLLQAVQEAQRQLGPGPEKRSQLTPTK
jgi:hypothetical protein